jgi:transposase InsO family protein
MENVSIGGSRYFLIFIDDKTCKIFVYFLETKSAWEVSNAFEDFRKLAENQSNKKIKILRTDNGSAYTNQQFQKILREIGNYFFFVIFD